MAKSKHFQRKPHIDAAVDCLDKQLEQIDKKMAKFESMKEDVLEKVNKVLVDAVFKTQDSPSQVI